MQVVSGVNCPSCGSSQVRKLSPGFFECVGSVVTDVVPPGVHGNPAPMPVTRACGNRFQVGGDVDMTNQCACGLFAVGTCQMCGAAICGVHGTHRGMYFVCVRHGQEAVAAEAAENARRSAEAKRAAELQRQRALEARHAAIPGFPHGASTAQEVSAALSNLVLSRTRPFVVERRSLGRSKRVRGWGFVRSSVGKTNHIGGTYFRHQGFIVTDDGRAYEVAEESTNRAWAPGDHEYGPAPHPKAGLSADEVEQVFVAVLGWTGKRLAHSPGEGPTPARMAHLEMLVVDGRLSRAEAEGLAPDGSVSDEAWATIRDR